MFRNPRQYNFPIREEQFSNMWQLIFVDYPELDFHIKDISIPFFKLEMEGRKYGKKFYTSYAPMESISITFRELESFSSYNFFMNWMEQIYDFRTGTFKVLDNEGIKYKDATITFLQKYGGMVIDVPTKAFTLSQLSPLGFSDVTLSTESGDPLEFTIELNVGAIRDSLII